MILFLLTLLITAPMFAGEKADKLKNFSMSEYLKASLEELLAHKRTMDELEKRNQLNITPTQAQLFHSDPVKNRKMLSENITDARMNRIATGVFTSGELLALDNAMANEQKIYDNGGAAVHHSIQPDIYGHDYIQTKKHDFVLDILGTPVVPSKFLLLRDPICDRTDIESEKQKREEYLSQGVSDDWSHRKDLLACSISLGNTTPGESSLDFWLDQYNVRRPTMILGVGSKSQLIPRVNSLKEKLKTALQNFKKSTKTGVLLQLAFKDKKMVDDIMYHAKPFGGKKYYSKLKKPTDVFGAMMQKPSEFSRDDIQEEQVRVILTADKMLNATDPKIRHSVAMHAYTDNQPALDEFHTEVDAAFARAKEDYVARQKTLPLSEQLWLKPNLFYKRAAKDLAD
jgi:hypothetical protein